MRDVRLLMFQRKCFIITVSIIEFATEQRTIDWIPFFAPLRRFPTPIRLVDFVGVVGGYKNKDFNDLREEFQVSRSHD